jgi:hypothetical protein
VVEGRPRVNGRDVNGFTADIAPHVDLGPAMKCCRGCRGWKVEDTYHFRRLTSGHMLRICRRCEADRARVRREATSLGQRNRDRIRERYWQNPEAERARARQKYYDQKLAET